MSLLAVSAEPLLGCINEEQRVIKYKARHRFAKTIPDGLQISTERIRRLENRFREAIFTDGSIWFYLENVPCYILLRRESRPREVTCTRGVNLR